MSDLSTNEDFRSWIGRKTARLARELLDCGHPNAGEVYFHGWCDRLSCSGECAEAGHDCSAFTGAKSGTEEMPEPVEAAGHTWTVNPGTPGVPRAGVCRNCGSWLSLNVPLCPPCEGLPPCVAEHYSGALGQRIACLLPAGHRRDHEDVTGSQWVEPVSMPNEVVEALRQSLEPLGVETFTLNNSTGRFTPRPWIQVTTAYGEEVYRGPVEPWPQPDPVAPPVDELVEPAGFDVHRLLSEACSAYTPLHEACSGDALDLLSACLCACHQPKRASWWSRLLPDRRTR